MTQVSAAPASVYRLPGEAVFPESVGVDPATGAAFVGSLADGAIYRLDQGRVEVFSAAGEHGRVSVAGVKVDPQGRLWAAGGYDGTLFVHSIPDADLLARLELEERPSCMNDIAFGPDGTAYVTDSFVPALFRVTNELDELERWIDLRSAGVPWPEGLNFNGIVLTPDRQAIVVCQTNTGRFWRIGLGGHDVGEMALDGGPLEHCDGLALHGTALYVAVNALEYVAVVMLEPDGRAGRVTQVVRSEAFAFPTATAVRGDRLLVVNAQLDRMGATPVLPFTVVEIARPAT